MKAVAAVIFACLAPGLGFAASLTGSIVNASATANLSAVGTLDWARWPGYSHRGADISNVTTIGTPGTIATAPHLIGDRTGLRLSGAGSAFELTVAATTIERTLTYYVGGWNSTARITATLAGATPYTATLSSSTAYGRVVTLRFRADAPTTLRVSYTQTSGAGNINMQAAALSQVGGSTSLSWQAPAANIDGTPLTNLAGYKIYWGTTRGSYPYSAQVSNAATRAHMVTGLASGTWYFAVTALSSNGVESAYSNVWQKTIP